MHKTDSFPLRPTSGLLAPIRFKKSLSMEQQSSGWYQNENIEFTKSNSLSSSASEGAIPGYRTNLTSTNLGNTGIKLTSYNLPSDSPRRIHHVEPLGQKTFTPALSPVGEPSDSVYNVIESSTDEMELRQTLSNLDKDSIINLFISSKLHAKQYKDVQKSVTSISIADNIDNILDSFFRYSKQILKCQDIKFYVPNPDNSGSIIDYTTKQIVPYDEGIIGEVLQNSSAKAVENVQSKSQYKDYEDSKVNSILCVPAYDYKQRLICIGKAINKNNNAPFNEDDERSFLILLLTTGNNFKRAMLLERLKSAQESTTSALKITQVLSSSINYEEIIRDIINITKEIVQCKFFRLLLVEGSELVDYTSNFRKSIEGSLSGECIKTSHVITIGDFSSIKPEKLMKEIDTIQPNELINMLCVPILDQDNHNPVAVLEAYNHNYGQFTKEEENLLQYIADTASVQFHHSKLHKQAMVQEKMNRGLVQIMKIVSQTDDKDDIFTSLNKLVEIGYDGVDCERITVFLLDANTHTLHTKISRDLDPNYHLPLNNSIAGCCIASKQTINISNAYNDNRFNKAFDKETGFQTKSIIALCLTDAAGNPIGVLEAVNKKGIHQRFDDDDILLLNTLATEISNFLRKRAMELAYEVHSLHSNNQSSKFIQSLLSQYSEVTTPISPQPVLSTTTLLPKQISLMNHSNEIASKIESWAFNSLEYEPDQLFPFIKYCFDSYDLFHQWNIDQNKFFNFIKVVQSNYFDNPYHNYFHAMGVFHICFMFLKKAEAVKGITAIDTLALLLSAIVHDIDHPGHNNDYEIKLGSTLSILYNDQSVLENHHCALTFQLMRDNSCALLSSLSYNDYRLLRKGMIQAILATDMVHHNEYIKYVEDFVPKPNSNPISSIGMNNNNKNIDEEESRKLIATIIHAADLSNPVVPSFDVCRDWSIRICTEFSNQFNHEKENNLPISYHMQIDVNNDSAVAAFQLSFIDFVIRPLWNPLVTKIYPLANELIGFLNNNYKRWKELANKNSPSDSNTTDSKNNK